MFTTIYPTIFAALAIGVSAVPVPSLTSIDTIDVDTFATFDFKSTPVARAPPPQGSQSTRYKDALKAATKAGKRLEPNKSYVFTLEWDLPAVPDGSS
jgi:hypothetical protein